MIQFFKRNRLEFLGGISTFATMAYIIILNPAIFSQAGVNEGSVMTATIIATIISTVMMGLISNFPIAIAPALSITPYLAFTVINKLGFSFAQAMGAVFISSAFLLILNVLNIRQKLVLAIPEPLRQATTCGIGFFLIIVGLEHINIIKQTQNFITYDKIFTLETLLTSLTLLTIYILSRFKIKAAFILSILFFWAVALVFKITTYHGVIGSIPSLDPTFFQVDMTPLGTKEYWAVILSVFLIALMDTSAALISLCSCEETKKIPDLQPSLFCDSIGSMVGGIIGAGSLTFHLESYAGIKAGGKKGLTAIVTACLFIACLFIYPLVKSIPDFASSAVIIFVGYLMLQKLKTIPYKSSVEFIPSVLLIATMGVTLSIYNGLCIGFFAYAFFRLLTKNIKDVDPLFWALTVILFLHRIFLEI